MIDAFLQFNDLLFKFVTRGPMWRHVAAFLPLGLAVGFLVARWSARMVVRESQGERHIPRWARTTVILVMGALYAIVVVAVMDGRCQWITEGGSIDWGHWRLLYHYTLIAFLVAATTVDFDQYLIPDEITGPGVLIGIIAAAGVSNMQMMQVWVDWNQAHPITGPYIPQWIKDHPHLHGLAFSVAGMVTGAGITWLARAVSEWVLGIEAMGLGDVTLMAMIGSFLGWQPVLFVFLLAPACGLVAAISSRLLWGKRALPYGPYLSAAAVLVLLTWRWLWTPTREIFGHWPTLLGLISGMIASLALLLGLLRIYRSIPVELRTPEPTPESGNAPEHNSTTQAESDTTAPTSESGH
ncbi:MAG: prepilin peptidase [Planctomycetes bacterium]|nr:prepilin peptidase [Planctomycetota bacterium]